MTTLKERVKHIEMLEEHVKKLASIEEDAKKMRAQISLLTERITLLDNEEYVHHLLLSFCFLPNFLITVKLSFQLYMMAYYQICCLYLLSHRSRSKSPFEPDRESKNNLRSQDPLNLVFSPKLLIFMPPWAPHHLLQLCRYVAF